ncbi:MAG: hypothetical protein ABFS18_06015 [Thermodesulfobacteriota bacterium]
MIFAEITEGEVAEIAGIGFGLDCFVSNVDQRVESTVASIASKEEFYVDFLA